LLNGSWKGGGSRGGHFQVILGAEFIVLDVGRANNLWQTRGVEVESTCGWTVSSRHKRYLSILCTGTKTVLYLPSRHKRYLLGGKLTVMWVKNVVKGSPQYSVHWHKD